MILEDLIALRTFSRIKLHAKLLILGGNPCRSCISSGGRFLSR